MGTNEMILLQAQAGIESSRGTNVAATRKIYAQITPKYDRSLMDFQDTSGTFEARRRVAYGREKVSFSAADILTYEDLAWWAQFMIKGGVTGTGSASVGYTYAFTPSLATDDLKSMTLEFGDAGNPYETGQVMCNSWTLRMDADNDSEPGWMLDAELIGRDWTPTTFTTALTDRATEVVLARGTKFYLDDGGGTIGSTQKTGSLISASITGTNNIHYKAFAEDTAGYAAGKVGRGPRTIEGQFTVEFEDDTEFAKFRNATGVQKLIRLEQTGSTIATTYTKKFTLDLYGYYSSWSRGDREGNLTATFGFMGFYDSTAGKTMSATVVNALSALA